MSKSISVPAINTFVLDDHEPYWQNGERLTLTLSHNGEAIREIKLLVSDTSLSRNTVEPITHTKLTLGADEYRLWYNREINCMNVDSRIGLVTLESIEDYTVRIE